MFSIGEVSKMLNVTRQTIYNKLDNKELKPYIIESEKGKKITPEGIDVLKVILSQGKALEYQTENKIDMSKDNQIESTFTSKNDVFLDMYIKTLQSQIDEMKQEKADMQSRYDLLLERFTTQQVLLSDKPKSNFWTRLLGRS